MDRQHVTQAGLQLASATVAGKMAMMQVVALSGLHRATVCNGEVYVCSRDC